MLKRKKKFKKKSNQSSKGGNNNYCDSVVSSLNSSTRKSLNSKVNQTSNFSPGFDKITSGRVSESSVVACLDKLFFVTKRLPPNYEELLKESKPTFSGSGRNLVIDEETKNKIWFSEDLGETGYGLRVSLNPSKFSSVWEMLKTIELVYTK